MNTLSTDSKKSKENSTGFSDADREALVNEAWEKIATAIQTGKIPMSDGSLKTLSPGELSRLLQWLAGLNTQRKRHHIPLPEDFRIGG